MTTDRMRLEIPSGAQLPVAHLLRHQSLRRAGQGILSLLLAGLAAAAVWLLAVAVATSAGGVGPHFHGPPPHPVPVANPSPVPPGS